MGLEDRNGRLYLYRKERSGERVRSVYWGRGELAEAMGRLEALEREERAQEREARRLEREAVAELARAGEDFSTAVRAVVRAALIAGGFHEHKREWRRSRG